MQHTSFLLIFSITRTGRDQYFIFRSRQKRLIFFFLLTFFFSKPYGHLLLPFFRESHVYFFFSCSMAEMFSSSWYLILGVQK